MGFFFLFNLGERPAVSPARPKCNSILHLYGKWLFEAAYIGTDFSAASATASSSASASITSNGAGQPAATQGNKRPTSLHIDAGIQQQQQQQPQQQATTPTSRKTSVSTIMSHSVGPSVSSVATAGSASADSSLELPAALTPERFESGRAEAVGALGR